MRNEDPERFDELGYCIFRNGLNADEVSDCSRRMEVLQAAQEMKGEPHYYFEEWLNTCRHPRILDAVESILGPELVLFYSSVFVKQPRAETRVEWHQDNPYWQSVSGTDVVTVWLALDDVDEENSCMYVIPGSHSGHREIEMINVEDMTGAMLSRRVEVTPETAATAVPIILEAGQLSIHDSYIIHGSEPNVSDRRRAGYTIRYGNALTTEIDQTTHTHSEHPVLPVYYVRGSGAGLRSTYIDARR